METQPKLIKSSIGILIFMLITKIAGFVREAVIAYYYGATDETDVYFLASGIIINIFSAVGGALSASVVPVYTRAKLDSSEKARHTYTSLIAWTLGIGVLTAALIFIFAPMIAPLAAPDYDESQLHTVALIMRMIGLSAVFHYLMMMYTGILNAEEQFNVPQLAGVILSVTTIVASALLSARIGIWALVYSHIVSSFLQGMGLACAYRRKRQFPFVWKVEADSIEAIRKLMGPLLLGNSLVFLNNLIDKFLGARLLGNVVSTLSYAFTLYNFICSLLITTVATVLYTQFCRQAEAHQEEELKQSGRQACILMIMILVPVAAMILMFGESAVEFVYSRGAFTAQAATATTMLLKCYTLGLVFQGIWGMLSYLLLAKKCQKAVMYVSVLSMLVNATASILLTNAIGENGIAIGTSISTVVAAGAGYYLVRRCIGSIGFSSMLLFCAKVAGATLISVGICVLCAPLLGGIVYSLFRLAASAVLFIICYAAALWAFRCHEFRTLLASLQALVKKEKNG